MRIKLSETHLKQMYSIIDQYRSLDTRLNTVNKELEIHQSIQAKMLCELEELHKTEMMLNESLADMYGKGKIDLYTLENVIS